MATLQEALSADLSGYVPTDGPKMAPPISDDLMPRFNSFVRCPVPPVSASPDSLRQFYLGGKVPQMRLLTPPTVVGQSKGGTVVNTTVVTNSSGSGNISTSISATQKAITTPTLNPNDVFEGSLLLAKSFQLLQITSSSACRIELYGTATSQKLDVSRAIDVPPAAGVFQNIISDVALDTSPYQWPYQNRIGANGDSPQSSLIYITVTNLDVKSDVVTVTISYVPLEQ